MYCQLTSKVPVWLQGNAEVVLDRPIMLTVGYKCGTGWVRARCCFRLLIHWLLAGKWATVSARSNSASSCKLLDSAAETGAHDKVSAVYTFVFQELCNVVVKS